MRVIAIDPGTTTGVAVGYSQLHVTGAGGHFELRDSAEFGLEQLSELAKYIRKNISTEPSKVTHFIEQGLVAIVIEDFVLYAGAKPGGKAETGLSPVYVTGYLDRVLEVAAGGYGWRHRKEWYFRQSASNAKSTVTDARAKALGLWIVGKPHATDACRHAELFCRRHVEL